MSANALARRAAFAAALVIVTLPALAGSYEFLAAPEITLNRVYRLDKATGEVGACQYGLKENSAGVTLCYAPGEGAGAQAAGEYGLIASRHEKEGGVFRVNFRDGSMSICYVLEDKVVCTTPGKWAQGDQPQLPAASSLPRPERRGDASPRSGGG